MKKTFLLFQLLIIALSTIIGLIFTDTRYLNISFLVFIILFSCYFIFLLCALNKQKAYEKKAYEHLITEDKVDCCVVVVVKNEGETIINTIKHYMAFPEKLSFIVYDDESTDNTVESLMKLGEKSESRIEIRELIKRDIFVHPKAFGTENAFNSVKCDLFLVIDADTIITHSDFLKGFSAMKNNNIDVLHMTRRNDKKNSLVDRLADVEELMNMAFHLTKLNKNQFSGSGYLVKKEIIKGLKYNEGITSEDTYVLKYLRAKGAKISFFYTLFAHERAPKNYPSMIKQRVNWLKQSAPFYIKHYFFLTTYMHVIFALSVVGLFFPLSIGFIFSSIILSILFAIEISIALKIVNESIFKTIYYTFLLILNMAFVVWPAYLALLFKLLLTNSPGKILKNK